MRELAEVMIKAVLQHVIQSLHAGEYHVALDYGFDWDEIRALEALSLQDFQWMNVDLRLKLTQVLR